jgi:multidrug resistance efflux pump
MLYFMQALGDSLDERPTHAAVQEASRQAAEATQQQLTGLAAELDALKARLRGAGQDLQQLKDWQVRCRQLLLQQAVGHAV